MNVDERKTCGWDLAGPYCCNNDCEQGDICPVRAVQASRDTGCCSFDPTPSDALPAAGRVAWRWERVAYWACVGLATGCTVGVVFGSLGYFTARVWGVL